MNLPDMLVFTVPNPISSDDNVMKRLQIVPAWMTEDPKKAGETRHQQALDIMEKEAETNTSVAITDQIANELVRAEKINAGSLHGGEPKTQSCTVNNQAGNSNEGLEGQMTDEQREEFLGVWKKMAETGKDKVLRDIISRKLQQSFMIVDVPNGAGGLQNYGVTVHGHADRRKPLPLWLQKY